MSPTPDPNTIEKQRFETARTSRDGAGLRPAYLPPAILEWAEANRWLLEDTASRWLDCGQPPRRADLQQALMATGQDVYLAGILQEMPTPLGWTESHQQRVVLTLFGLRMAPCMSEVISGLGPLVALAVARYRESGSRACISLEDIERELRVNGPAAAGMAERLFVELPFLGATITTEASDAREVREDIVRYASVKSTDDYLAIRAEEVRGHPQFGWRRWEPREYEPEPTSLSAPPPVAAPAASRLRWLATQPWVVGIGTVVVGGVILALILGHG